MMTRTRVLTIILFVTYGIVAMSPLEVQISDKFLEKLPSYLVVVCLGFVVGATELISRYKDSPIEALLSSPGTFYMAFNGMASILALYLLHIFEIDFGLLHDDQGAKINNPSEEIKLKLETYRVLVAGLSATAFFRTSLFNVRIGESDVNIGPNAILQIILKTIDRTVDRTNADRRAKKVERAVDQLKLNQAAKDLPIICFALMSNLSLEEMQYFDMNLKTLLADQETTEKTKKIAIGCALSDLVGLEVLEKAVDLCDKVVSLDDEFEMYKQRKETQTAT